MKSIIIIIILLPCEGAGGGRKGTGDAPREVTGDKVTSFQDECWGARQRKKQGQGERFLEQLEEEVL